MPSWIFIVLLGVGATLAAVATTLYPNAKEAEKKAELAKAANAILAPEIELNKSRLVGLRPLSAAPVAPLNYFEVNSWEAVSKGGLLLGLEAEHVKKLIAVYSLIYKANYLQGRLFEYTVGPSSNLKDTPDMVKGYRHNLSDTFDGLDATFRELEK